MERKRLRSGIVGCGFIGAAHIEACRRLGNVDVVALADAFHAEEKAQSFYVPKGYTDYKEMIEKENLDCIHICTPNNTHYAIAKAAMNQQVHVICEKPMTATVEEAYLMADLAAKTGLVNALNFHNRFYPMTNYMKTLYHENYFGEVLSIHGGYMQDWLLYSTDFNWRLRQEFSGKTRAIADIGTHWMDLVQFITGLKIKAVFADCKTVYEKRLRSKTSEEVGLSGDTADEQWEAVDIDTEDFAILNFRLENGALVNGVISQMFAGEKNKISLMLSGTKASVTWDSNQLNTIVVGHRNKPNEILEKDAAVLKGGSEKLMSYPAGHVEGFPDAFKNCFREVYAAIESPGQYQFATFQDGLTEAILCEKIVESARKGQWVTIE